MNELACVLQVLPVVMAGAVVFHARRGEPVVSAAVLLVLTVGAATLRTWIAS